MTFAFHILPFQVVTGAAGLAYLFRRVLELAAGSAPLQRQPAFVDSVPKRFAQFVGLIVSIIGTVLFIWVGPVAGKSAIGLLAVFAALESGVGFCAGCFMFRYLMEWGLIPESICLECRID